jgi:putative transposase
MIFVAERRLKPGVISESPKTAALQSSLRDEITLLLSVPWVETHGYRQSSLRDERSFFLQKSFARLPFGRENPLGIQHAERVMANTYTSLHFHFIFSTKNRERWITPEIEDRIWSFLGGIARKNKIHPLQIGGIDDHVHVLVGAPPTLAPSNIVQLIKGGSSAWIHETFPHLKDFAWQDGFGGFTVSKSNIPDVATYIRSQREHHRTRSFQEEYLAFLKKHEVDFNEKYVFD